MIGRLTTHVLDTAQGRPAGGMAVSLWRLGDEGEKTFAELNAFADEVDVAIVGLGN